jgi:pimeloyl-ACP methyl ester carboxylesterase
VGLHGWAGTLGAFDPLVPLLPADVTLLRFDLPGCGRSPRPAAWDLEAIAGEIASAIEGELAWDARGIAPLTLIGNCSGALLALLAGQQLGGRVGRYVLVDPFAYLPAYFRLLGARGPGRAAYWLAFENAAGRRIANASLAHRRGAATSLTSYFERTDHEANRHYLRLFARVDPARLARGMARLETPVDLVYGSRTFAAVRRSVPAWRAAFPQARAIEVPGAGHLPIRDRPEALARVFFG